MSEPRNCGHFPSARPAVWATSQRLSQLSTKHDIATSRVLCLLNAPLVRLRLARSSASEDLMNIKKTDASGQMAAVPRKPGTPLRSDTSDGKLLSRTLGASIAKIVRRASAVLPFVLWRVTHAVASVTFHPTVLRRFFSLGIVRNQYPLRLLRCTCGGCTGLPRRQASVCFGKTRPLRSTLPTKFGERKLRFMLINNFLILRT